MSSIKEKLALVRSEIKTAALLGGRNADEIKLIAVSKGQPMSAIEEAYKLGQRDFGESYAQEMALKIKESQDKNMPGLIWHFIGAIQSNKIKLIAKAQEVHSLSTIRQTELLEHYATHPIDVYLQVNLDQDPGRQGFFEAELPEAIDALEPFRHLHLKGLMAIAPLKAATAPSYWFLRMQMLRNELQRKCHRPLALSMGMSDDFLLAVAHGADALRIGSSIFGPRMSR